VKILDPDWFEFSTSNDKKRDWEQYDLRRIFEKKKLQIRKALKEERNKILGERLINPSNGTHYQAF
jgi:hypothetical protein